MNERTSQMINDMAKQLEDQLINVETQIQEFERLMVDLEEYSNIKEGSEIMASITNGIFVKAKAIDTKKYVINVGGQVLVEKTPEETKEMISKQIDDLQKYRDELLERIENSNQNIQMR